LSLKTGSLIAQWLIPLLLVFSPGARAAAPVVLFDGNAAEDWVPVQFKGGSFKDFARYEQGALIVDVPAGNDWGNTGIRSAAPLVPLPHPQAGEVVRLTVEMDATQSGAVFLSLVPPEKAAHDERGAHDFRFGLLTPANGPVQAIVSAHQREKGRLTIDDRARLNRVTLILRPDAVVMVEDAHGTKLFEAVLSKAIPPDGWHLHAIAKASVKGQAAKLVLRRVTLTREALVDPGDPDAATDDPATPVTLFDGHTLGHRWLGFEGRGGNFHADVSFPPGAMKAMLPEGSKGLVGLYTDRVAIWLDRFTTGAETRLDFAFLPEETTAFTLALAARRNVNGNTPKHDGLMVEWRALPAGITEPVTEIKLSPPQIQLRSARAPSSLALVLSPGEFRIEAEGFPRQPFAWDELADGQGLRMYVYLQGPGKGEEARMALRGIRMTRKPGLLPPGRAEPLRGIEPLPEQEVFDGNPQGWRTYGVHGVEADTAEMSGAALTVTLDGKKRNASAGILSNEPIIRLDERIRRTPFRVTQHFDPGATTAFNVLVTRRTDPRAALGKYTLGLSLAPAGPGPFAGQYLLTLHANGVFRIWQRPVDPVRLHTHWDGNVVLEMGANRVTAILPGVTRLSARGFGFAPYQNHHLMVDARPTRVTGPVSLRLTGIQTGWVTPPLMDALDRLELVDIEAFDPDAFVKEITRGALEILP
jgi:hypothetical protein